MIDKKTPSQGLVTRLNHLEREMGSIVTSVQNIEMQYRGVIGAIDALRSELANRGKPNWSAIAVVITIGALALAPLHTRDAQITERLKDISTNLREHELNPERVLREIELRSELVKAQIETATKHCEK